ncbi:MAG TPA: hypothetical protein VMZ06_16980 [Candidatus Bathyarchaeia archaeon]|nr:hypothetical protein [Candidatus Bathyarchaeia archaeon]
MRDRMPHHGYAAGFSLIEMTAALFVLGAGLLGTVQMYQFAIAKIQTMRESEIAARAVEEEIEALRAMPFKALEPGEELDFFSKPVDLDKLADAALQLSIRPHPDAALELKEVTAIVRWRGENGRLMEKDLTTFIAAKDDR